MDFKERYLLARANGEDAIKLFRGDEISKRIAKKYPYSAQIAILYDKDIDYNQYIEYQTYRAECKSAIDIEISAIEAEINHSA